MIRDNPAHAAWRPVSTHDDNATVKLESQGINENAATDKERGAAKPKDGAAIPCTLGLDGVVRLVDESPTGFARLYGLAVQIETAFRDLKSHQYGSAFEDTQTRVGLDSKCCC